MKKILVSIAIISASILSTYAATNNSSNTDRQTRTECTCDGAMQHKGKHGSKQDRGMKAFEGITLTDTQKSQIEALRAEQKARKEAAKKQRNENKQKKENLTDEQRQQLRAEKQKQREEAHQQFDAKMKTILTPEQYAKFLENTKEMAAHKDNKDLKRDSKSGKSRKDRRGDKDQKHQRGGKARHGNSNQG